MHSSADYVQGWLRKANVDYQSFLLLESSSEDLSEAAAFHAQQAVEKWLKALLTYNDVDTPYTHDLTKLLPMLTQFYTELGAQEWLERASLLNGFAVEIRYIDEENPLRIGALNLNQIKESLEAFRTFTNTKLGTHWKA